MLNFPVQNLYNDCKELCYTLLPFRKRNLLLCKKHWHSNSSVVYSAENKTVDYKQTAKRENIFEIFSPQFKSQLHFFVSEPLHSGKKRMQTHFQSPSSSSSLNIWLSRSRLDEVLLLLAVRITFPPPISPGMVSISVFYVRDFSCIGCLLNKSSSLESSGDWHGAYNFSK